MSTDDLEVFAREAATSLARQEQRLEDQRKRALDAISAASIVFGLFGAFRGEAGITWAIVLALAVFVFLVAVGVALQFSGPKPWYFAQSVEALKRKRTEMSAAGGDWNVHGYMADQFEVCYDTNAPRIDSRRRWLGYAFASLGAIVVFLMIDLFITHNDNGSTNGQPAAVTTTTNPGNRPP